MHKIAQHNLDTTLFFLKTTTKNTSLVNANFNYAPKSQCWVRELICQVARSSPDEPTSSDTHRWLSPHQQHCSERTKRRQLPRQQKRSALRQHAGERRYVCSSLTIEFDDSLWLVTQWGRASFSLWYFSSIQCRSCVRRFSNEIELNKLITCKKSLL